VNGLFKFRSLGFIGCCPASTQGSPVGLQGFRSLRLLSACTSPAECSLSTAVLGFAARSECLAGRRSPKEEIPICFPATPAFVFSFSGALLPGPPPSA
jgi:hypothetical protein